MEDKGGDSDEDRMMSRWKGEGIFFFLLHCFCEFDDFWVVPQCLSSASPATVAQYCLPSSEQSALVTRLLQYRCIDASLRSN